MSEKIMTDGYARLIFSAAALLAAGLLMPGQPAFAQQTDGVAEVVPEATLVDEDDVEEVVELKSLSDDQNKSLDETRVTIKSNASDIDDLEIRAAKKTGIMREVLETRLDTLITAELEDALSFAGEVADLRDDGYDISEYAGDVDWILEQLPSTIQEVAVRIRERVIVPDFSQSAAEQAAIDEQFFAAVRAFNKTDKALIAAAEMQRRYALDPTALEDDVSKNLADGAANISVFLDLAIAEVNNLRAGVIALPDDTELQAKLSVAQDRVQKIAGVLETNISIMTDMDVSTTQYKQQLLTATGAITASTLDLDVVSGLLQDWASDLIEFLIEKGPGFLFQVLLFLFIVYVFMKLAGLVQRGINSALDANKQHFSHLLRQMISATSKNIIILFGVLIALSQLGISLGPLLTGLGIAGFIVGFALQDSLSNFASGMMILFYRPFDVGDTIDAGGARGQVSSMSLVNTTIRTFDNQSLIIPNNKIWQNVITNVTDQKTRRVDMTFGITYDQDIDTVENLLLDIVKADERVLDNPEPLVKVGSFSESSVDLLCRPWVKTEDYWNVLWDLNKKIKQAFDREGISIPFPQRDVHIYNESAAGRSRDSSLEPAELPEGNKPIKPQGENT